MKVDPPYVKESHDHLPTHVLLAHTSVVCANSKSKGGGSLRSRYGA